MDSHENADEENRNGLNTTKKKYAKRNIIDLRPLTLSEWEKDELSHEPLFKPGSLENDGKESLHIKSSNKDNVVLERKEAPESNAKLANRHNIQNNNGARTLQTPAKFHPKNANVENNFVTPKNKNPPKIQCSVNMTSHLKTPMGILCNSSKNKPNTATKPKVTQCDLEHVKDNNFLMLSGISESSFRTIRVNKVVYTVLNMVGKGGSSEVFHCYNVDANTHCAIKCVCLDNTSFSSYKNEVEVLKQLQDCTRIVKMFDFEIMDAEKTLLVVLEIGDSDLSKILKELVRSSSPMPLYMLLYYWMEMLYAVQQIHSRNIIHSDLKPANFLKVKGCLKLIDFGISRCIQNDMTSVFKLVPEGSFNYVSPEALCNENIPSNTDSPSQKTPMYKISYKSDVWSLGCILYQMVYRRTPFQHIQPMMLKLATILNPDHKVEFPEAPWVSQRIIETMKRCLRFDMRSRPSVNDLISEYENLFQSL